MILELSECEINYEVDIDKDKVSDIPHIPTLTHLIKDKWVIIKAVTSSSVISESTDDQFFVTLSLELKLMKIGYGWYHYRHLLSHVIVLRPLLNDLVTKLFGSIPTDDEPVPEP